MLTFQAVILAGGASTSLFPLTSPNGTPKALLSVGNQPMISYPLKLLEKAGVKEVIILCAGEATAAKVSSYISKQYQGGLSPEVRAVPEACETADALRLVADRLTRPKFVVLSVDLISDVSLQAIVASHVVRDATVTSVLTARRTSPSLATKPGKAPKNVDYIAIDAQRRRLQFFVTSKEPRRDLSVRLSALHEWGAITLRTDLSSAHLYVFDRETVFEVLQAKEAIHSIQQDLVPYLVRHQLHPNLHASKSKSQRNETLRTSSMVLLPGGVVKDFSQVQPKVSEKKRGWYCSVFTADAPTYCTRVNTLASYSEACRELAVPSASSHLVDAAPNTKHDNFMHESVVLGNKATVASGCMVGRGTSLGDKSSVKRSVLGVNCRLGVNVKVINSVIMDGVVVGDGCHVQNCIICAGAVLGDHATLRDCQVGPDFSVTADSEHREEVLAKGKAH